MPKPAPVNDSFPKWLADYRIGKQMSQAMFGELIGVDKDTIRSWERGRSKPTMNKLRVIAEKCGTDVEDHLEPEPEPEPAPEPARPGVRMRLAAIWPAIRRRTAIAVVGAVAVAAVANAVARSGEKTVTIYWSLPKYEAREPVVTPEGGRGADPVPTESTLSQELEQAMKLALKGNRAGEFKVEYRSLDRSDKQTGESPDAKIEANARKAARDESTAVFIGELGSGPSRLSIPILSRARVLQISPLATQVGLTRENPQTGRSEPAKYYADLPGYEGDGGYRNFVRIIPADDVQARALLAVMTQSGDCHEVAMINDNTPYGEALANNVLALNSARKPSLVRFAYSQSVDADGIHAPLLAKAVRKNVDCFVYAGTVHPHTVEIFEDFARELPGARLFGTDGLAAPSFYEVLRANVAPRVTIMVPPYGGSAAYAKFVAAFKKANHDKIPSPKAVYAYEAVLLALKAITRSPSGKPGGGALFKTHRTGQQSVLGAYDITEDGDTSVKRYGVSTIENGKLSLPPRRAPPLRWR